MVQISSLKFASRSPKHPKSGGFVVSAKPSKRRPSWVDVSDNETEGVSPGKQNGTPHKSPQASQEARRSKKKLKQVNGLGSTGKVQAASPIQEQRRQLPIAKGASLTGSVNLY